uniref:Cathepsin L n=1 Tax=Aceria tosichella TaxID=561515 RepID=A0A6G1SGX9_9ACAR
MRFLIVVAVACLAFIGQLVSTRHHSSASEWIQYKKQHGKIYETPEEDAYRFSLFLAAKDKIESHNRNFSVSYKLGLNHLSDWSPEELSKLTGFQYNANEDESFETTSQSFMNDWFLQNIMAEQIPVGTWQFDWRQRPGRVGRVKDQGRCASGWAFATTGLLEGQQLARNRSASCLIPLSEQQLMDCSNSNDGCHGGRVSLALDDIAQMGGIESELNYPYVAKRADKCNFNRSKSVMTDSGFVRVAVLDPDQLLKVVYHYGPVAVGIAATENFLAYKSGVFDDSSSRKGARNHAILIVGFGGGLDETPYWVAKNSFGDKWGEEGYIRVARGDGDCIDLLPIIPRF